jgi:5-formyltetrahydrofolate cyclo-ligase
LTTAAAADLAATIQARVLALPEYAQAGLVHTYLATLENEVATTGVIDRARRSGRQVAAPVVVPGTRQLRHALVDRLDNWQPDRWGLLAPPADHSAWLEDLTQIGLVLVPGLAFDGAGRRLGYGGGYYDRFLRQTAAPRVGLTFDCLVLDQVPEEPHDVRVDLVLTETRLQRTTP